MTIKLYTVSGVENVTNLLDKNIWRRGEMQTNEFYTCIYKLTLMERAKLNDLINTRFDTPCYCTCDGPPPPHFLLVTFYLGRHGSLNPQRVACQMANYAIWHATLFTQVVLTGTT